MLDNFTIFARGGIILFSWSAVALKGNPIDALINTVLLEERSGQQSFPYNYGSTKYVLKWTFSNELGLVFVAVYQSILQVLYVEDLLNQVKRSFSERYKPGTLEYPEFVDEFQRMLNAQEHQADKTRKIRVEAAKKSKGTHQQSNEGGKGQELKVSSKEGKVALAASSNGSSNGASSEGTAEEESAIVEGSSAQAFNVAKLQQRRWSKSNKGKGEKADSSPKPTEKKPKQMRKWEDSKAPSDEKLDYSVGTPDGHVADGSAALKPTDMGQSGMDIEEEEEDQEEDQEEEEEEDSAFGGTSSAQGKGKRGWLSSMVRGLVGTESLEQEDLTPILQEIKSRLMSKNVAAEIVMKLCESVESGLLGKRQASFTRVSATVKTAMHDALVRILTPRRSTDVLREIQVSREKGQPYSIVFVGVNGVGKSTNLAKVAYWLLQHDMKVMIAACDTFRAGAVEQLRTHCRRLEATSGHTVPLFERGYEKDPASVAMEAMRQAKKEKCDVLLIDTAGRMQDNKPLMEALSKLIDLNKPDLALFVGEALVGNDAVDQLKKFNAWLTDLSTAAVPRLIDGIVLTKFDTVDEKVGAALSMVYESRAPIMFVGCGQTYSDLRKLNVKHIVNSLLK